MKNLSWKLVIALLTFFIGTVLALIWLTLNNKPAERIEVSPPLVSEIKMPMSVITENPQESSPVIEQPSNNVEIEFPVIENTIGLVVLSDNYDNGDFVQIYNKDGSLWHKFTYYYDDSDGEFEYANENFRPFAFHPDYFVLALKCVGKKNGLYEVIVNEETNLKKYVKANDKVLKLETWEKHLLGLFAVGFDEKENPMLEVPQGRAKKLITPDATFHPVKVKGDWVKVKWETTPKTETKEAEQDFGWIRWKKDGKLILELFNFC